MLRKKLGKIASAKFGWGGYQDVQFGLSVTLQGESWGCDDFKGFWGHERPSGAEWTEETRIIKLGETCLFLRDTLKAAQKQTVDQLVGVPVEVTFNGNLLYNWRILSEVL